MDASSLFDEKLVAIGLSEPSVEDTIRELANLLCSHGYTTEAYAHAVLEREKEFPTGLPTEPFGVALPHADSEHVSRTGIAVGILSSPLEFHVMGSSDETVQVRLVFLMAIREADLLVKALQGFALAFQKPEVLERLTTASSPSKVIETLESELDIAET